MESEMQIYVYIYILYRHYIPYGLYMFQKKWWHALQHPSLSLTQDIHRSSCRLARKLLQASVPWELWELSSFEVHQFSQHFFAWKKSEQWKKPWLVGLYRGLYYPVI